MDKHGSKGRKSNPVAQAGRLRLALCQLDSVQVTYQVPVWTFVPSSEYVSLFYSPPLFVFYFSLLFRPALLIMIDSTLAYYFCFNQAILPLRGKILNIEKCASERIYQNNELQALISALGLGIKVWVGGRASCGVWT